VGSFILPTLFLYLYVASNESAVLRWQLFATSIKRVT
jgi:hypothetical protein